ncbi:hypothetical protein ASPNIDRAFT_123758, partial [Aspergillus niger ATCC 1015]
GLLAVPFVLHSQPTAVYQEHSENLIAVAADTHQRYAEIFRDVEMLIRDHNTHELTNTVTHQQDDAPGKSKLKLLVPTVGTFFTPLYLVDAFRRQDAQRFISRRRFVAPSFNDIRLILNSAQLIGLARTTGVDLVTFDGDVTLYDDGACLTDDNPVILRIMRLLLQGRKVGINTVERSEVGARLPFCAFNGGNDVFVDIGDKSWGVRACQRYFGGIEPARTLHVGDQFLSAGANDFKARLASTTAWIASPAETVQLLDELQGI